MIKRLAGSILDAAGAEIGEGVAKKLLKRFEKKEEEVEDTVIQIWKEGDTEFRPSTDGSAGFDLRAHCGVPRIVEPAPEANSRWAIRTGVKLAMPPSYCALVVGRSGLAINNGIMVMAGLIDSDYRGEIRVILVNLGHEPFTIHPGDRIAQLIFQPVAVPNGDVVFDFVTDPTLLGNTDRGEGGFGSTGTR